MSPSVSDGDWSLVDNWWGSFRRDRSLVLTASHIRKLEDTWKDRTWESIDGFWDGFEADHELLFAERHVRDVEDDWKAGQWDVVDELWDSYAERQQADLAELRELMAELGEVWADGASPFDADPLTTNWRPESRYEGPLRTSVDEEDWSQWLAHLLRTSSGAFARAFLGSSDRPPARVRREVVFFGERSNRRADILVEYEDGAVSIEVKIGDEHYGKTPHTAALIERHDDRDWSHVLLLQKGNLPRLRRTFDERLERSEEGSPTIQSDRSPDIDVRFWQDVSRSIRRTLLDGREPDSHWNASAYLFVTLIEQRLLEFHSFSFVDPATTTGRTADTEGSDGRSATMDLHRLVAADPEAQIEYLRSVLQEDYERE